MKLALSKNYYLLLQIRFATGFAVSAFITGAVAAFSLAAAAALGTVFTAIYIFFAAFYIRRFTTALHYELERGRISISRGVLFKRRIFVPYYAVRYFEMRSTILSKRLNVYCAAAYTSSGVIRISGIEHKDARKIIGLMEESDEREKEG